MAASFQCWAIDDVFPTLTIGNETFTNVTVLNKTSADVFISHTRGMASFKVKELSPELQLRLGYHVEQTKLIKAENVFKSANFTNLANIESDPRVKQIQSQLLAKFGGPDGRLDPSLIWGIVCGAFLFYLIFCFLCRSICLKSAAPPSSVMVLIWFPLLQQIPLLKAAGMSPLWILTNFVPPLVLITYIIWCFKIVQARGKHVIFAIMLLFFPTNFFSFLYLAFSESNNDSDSGSGRRVISLQSSPRRDAA